MRARHIVAAGSSTSCVFALIMALVFGSVALAGDIYVDVANSCTGAGTVGDPYCTIQLAANSAVNGDVIHVAAGFYDENVDVDVAVSIRAYRSGARGSTSHPGRPSRQVAR